LSNEGIPDTSPNASRDKGELNKDALLETRGGLVMGDNNNELLELDELDNDAEPLDTPPSLLAPLVQHQEGKP
jgi:hypothetical protein